MTERPDTAVKPLETRYAGCRFRSRLEARWAVFFDALSIPWQYEPQGFMIPRSGGGATPYLPDFLLTECGTWIEVKGDESELDKGLMWDASEHLPQPSYRYEPGPRLMILGPIPEPLNQGDWGWKSLNDEHGGSGGHGVPHGFASYDRYQRPFAHWSADTDSPDLWLTPWLDVSYVNAVPEAYRSARSARFEHGERGAR